jgi:uncharacterized protein YkwD
MSAKTVRLAASEVYEMLESRKNLPHKLFGFSFLIAFVMASFVVASGQSSESKPRRFARLIFPPTKNTETNKPKIANASSSETPAANNSTLSFTPTIEEKRILELINKERRKLDLDPLRFDAKLCLYARSYSKNMAEKRYFSHINPDGKTMKDRVREAGLTGWKAVGENIAYNQGYDDPIAFAVERWMLSTSHRANILGEIWTETGIGVAKAADGSFYFTQIFIAR